MKRFWLLFLALTATTAMAAGLGDIKTVYLFPMSGGLDQYLAFQLTSGVVLQVVTDPQKADAILTDHVGSAFESSLDDLYGTKKKASEDEDKDKDSSNTFVRLESNQHVRGAIFLVDRKSRDVVWSDYEKPKSNSPDDLKNIALKVTVKLAKAEKGK